MKKLISMLLALTLVLAIVPTAFADEYITYTLADGSLTPTFDVGHSYNADTDTLKMEPGEGGRSGQYPNARHDQGGYISYLKYPEAIPANTTYYVSFDIKQDTRNVNALIRGLAVGEGRATYGPGIEVKSDGTLYINGTHWTGLSGSYNNSATVPIGTLPVNEWHNITLKYILNSTSGDGTRCEYYVDGVYKTYGINKYHYSDKGANPATCWKNLPHTQLSLSVSSNSQYVIGADGQKNLANYAVGTRNETIHVKNLVVSTDPATLDTSVQFTSTNARTSNKVVFTANKNVTEASFTAFSGDLTVTNVAVSGTTVTATLSGNMAENTEYTYTALVDGKTINGSFKTEWFEKLISSPYNDARLAVNSVGKQSKAVTGRYGEANGALAITNVQNNGGGADNADYTKYITKVNYVHAPNKLTTKDNEDLRISLDFMQGSSRVTSTLIALEQAYAADTKSVDYVQAVKLAADGTVTVNAVSQKPNAWTDGAATATAGLQIGKVNPKEWHNVTLAINVCGGIVGTIADVYFDGELKYDDVRIAQGKNITGFNGVSTTVIALGATDPDEIASITNPETGALYDGKDERRYDVIVVDNVYVGYKTEYKDSKVDIYEKSDGSALNVRSTGPVGRKNPVISALYAADGSLKDVKLNLLWKGEPFAATSVSGATKFDSAVAGDTIKVFVVSNYTDLTPISNVVTKKVQ